MKKVTRGNTRKRFFRPKIFAYAKEKERKITDGKSDALVLVQRIHNELKELQKAIDELEYLIYEKDERCQIELFNEAWNRRRDD